MGQKSELPEWVVLEVVPHEDYTLSLKFADGSRKKFDMRPIINKGKVFKPLEDISFFMQAHEGGSGVVWDDQIDIAPETLYEEGVDED